MIRILLALEPRAYREAIGLALRESRSGAEVIIAEPHDLDVKVRGMGPDLVVCNRATPFVRRDCPAWIELHTEGESRAVVRSVYGVSTVSDFDLSMILEIVDETVRIIETREMEGS